MFFEDFLNLLWKFLYQVQFFFNTIYVEIKLVFVVTGVLEKSDDRHVSTKDNLPWVTGVLKKLDRKPVNRKNALLEVTCLL